MHIQRETMSKRSLIRLLNLAISVAKSKEKFFGTTDCAAPLGVGGKYRIGSCKNII